MTDFIYETKLKAGNGEKSSVPGAGSPACGTLFGGSRRVNRSQMCGPVFCDPIRRLAKSMPGIVSDSVPATDQTGTVADDKPADVADTKWLCTEHAGFLLQATTTDVQTDVHCELARGMSPPSIPRCRGGVYCDRRCCL